MYQYYCVKEWWSLCLRNLWCNLPCKIIFCWLWPIALFILLIAFLVDITTTENK